VRLEIPDDVDLPPAPPLGPAILLLGIGFLITATYRAPDLDGVTSLSEPPVEMSTRPVAAPPDTVEATPGVDDPASP